MSKVGIIGDKDSIMGFLALGIDIFPAYTPEEIKKTIHSLAEKEYAIIYITEQASLQAGESLANIRTLNCRPSSSSPVSAAAWALA